MTPTATLNILHLSDTHLLARGLHTGTVDTRAALLEALRVLVPVEELDLVVVSGDASDDGTPESYRQLRELVGDFAAHRGAQVIFGMGNHDERPGFWQVLGNGHPGSAPEPDAGQLPIHGVSTVGGFRVVTLDSSVPGRTHGFLDRSQLDWLTEELSQSSAAASDGAAPHGTLLVVHHPPVEPVTVLHDGIELQNPEDLAEALRGSDVRLILSGHYHHALVDSLRVGETLVPVLVAPGVVNVNDVLAPDGHERALQASGAALVTLFASDRGPARVRALPLFLRPTQLLFDLDPAEVSRISARISARPEDGEQ
ncbi:metallophosphoesterase [Psychromicrobium xiongbiense]|uniref:metallophosphoesterase n=1 Tax=Psychromicrobium xiongbiense TaxID=3051184 RepID=UPI002557AAB0|nr:metallophosphoesterase [Psychromicrobium sp. YIM S02556]